MIRAKKLNKFALCTSLLAIFIGVLIALPSTHNVEADHKLESWPHTPGQLLELDVGINLSPRFEMHVEAVLDDWSSPKLNNPIRLTAVPGAGISPDGECPHTNGRIEVCNLDLGETGGSGFIQIDFDENGLILAAIAIINDFYFPGAPWENEMIHVLDRQEILCHELGHAIGLAHPDESGKSLGTCMDYSGESHRPGAHDYVQLSRQYGAKLFTINVGGVNTGDTRVIAHSAEAQSGKDHHESEDITSKPNEHGGITITITIPTPKR